MTPQPAKVHWLQGPTAVELADASFPQWLQRINPDGNASVRIVVCRPLRKYPRRVLRILQFTPRVDRMDQLVLSFGKKCGPYELIAVRGVDNSLLVWMEGPTPPLCSSVFRSGGICLQCTRVSPENPSPLGRRLVLLPNAVAVRELIQPPSPRQSAGQVVLRIAPFTASSLLSKRQRQALEVASRCGFFSTPRKGRLADVASALGVSRTTAMILLRRGVERLALERIKWDSLTDSPQIIVGEETR
jgi:hypothetical protein